MSEWLAGPDAPRTSLEYTLQVENLTVAYQQAGQWLDAVRDISLRIAPGQTYGLVGESGSGKTTLAMAIMRYLSENGQVRQGQVLFEGQDLLRVSERDMRRLWGAQIGLVPQNPLSALNPTIRVGEQLAEMLRQHERLDSAAAQARVLRLLRMVRLPDPVRVAQSYPHQISGGMQQRVLIAMALSASPRLLVLDEPTTSLDVTTQASILDLFRDLIHGLQAAVLYVTHNLGVVAQICDRVAVLYAGELVEDAPLADLFRQPLHPYTQGLLDSVPKLGQTKQASRLQSIQGQIPALNARPSGCVFSDRCPLAIEICRERPPLYTPDSRRSTRCHRWQEIAAGQVDPRQRTIPQAVASEGLQSGTEQLRADRPGPDDHPVLDVKDVSVHFALRRSLVDVLRRKPERTVRAVDRVSLKVAPGKTLGVVGESGSGKTTLARLISGLTEHNAGQLHLLGMSLPPRLSQRDRETLRHLQMVFQNPEEALNPHRSVGDSLRRPFITLLKMSPAEADLEVERLLAAVRLPADYARRRPNQLSGGEKQRIAIARAFATHPDLLIADEPVSSLDVSVQASILNLLNELQAQGQNSLLFISHDLAVVGYLADEIAVIYLGRLMEVSPAEALFQPPYHPYTEALLSAVPLPNPGLQQEPIRLDGELPSPSDVPRGCPFHTRCPRFLGEICIEQTPPWQTGPDGSRYFCHIPPDELLALQNPVIRPGP